MKTTKQVPLSKKRKLDAPFKPPTSVVDLATSSQQQDDSQSLAPSPMPIKPHGSKLDALLSIAESDSEDLCEESVEDSFEAQCAMERDDRLMCVFREVAQSWLLDHGKAFFHVEALSFLRDQERKKNAPSGPGGFGGGLPRRRL